MRHLLGRAEALGRNLLLQRGLVQPLGHIGFDESGSHGVDGDAATGHLLCQCLRGGNDATLCCRIVGLAGQPLQSADAGHIDDASELMQLHGRQQWLGDVEESGQRDVQYAVPIVLGHQRHHVVAPDAGIVDHHLDVFAVMALLPLVECRAHLQAVAHVEGHQFALTVTEFKGFLCLSLVAGIIDDDPIAFLG